MGEVLIKTYKIANADTGEVLGVYKGTSPFNAVETMWAESTYTSWEEYRMATGEPNLHVQEVLE